MCAMSAVLLAEQLPYAANRGMGARKESKAERALREAFPRGAWLDLRTGIAGLDDPADGHLWQRERTLRAQVISELLGRAARVTRDISRQRGFGV